MGLAGSVAFHACDRPEIDFDESVVAVDYTVVRVKGKGLIRKSTKFEHGDRTLPLPSWTVDMLRERFAGADDPEGPVFPSSLGGVRDPSNAVGYFGRPAVARASPGSPRKTAATVLDEAGLTARLIANQFGHSRPSMTQDVYTGRATVSRVTAVALESALYEAAE